MSRDISSCTHFIFILQIDSHLKKAGHCDKKDEDIIFNFLESIYFHTIKTNIIVFDISYEKRFLQNYYLDIQNYKIN